MSFNRWLLKTEPEDYSWPRFVEDGRTAWTGVRNHQAAGNLKAMRAGDLALFYRSVKAPAVVGSMRVVAEAYLDPTVEAPTGGEPNRWVCVDFEPVAEAPREVPLKAIKAVPALADVALIRQSRLSVMPLSETHWRELCAMAGLDSVTGYVRR